MKILLIEIIVCFFAGMGAGLGTGFAGMSAAAVISPMLITFLGIPAYEAVGIALASDDNLFFSIKPSENSTFIDSRQFCNIFSRRSRVALLKNECHSRIYNFQLSFIIHNLLLCFLTHSMDIFL